RNNSASSTHTSLASPPSSCTYVSAAPPHRLFFFFNAPATTEIYTLSLHDALPICVEPGRYAGGGRLREPAAALLGGEQAPAPHRSEEHTSELQSLTNLVCRLLLEKKKQTVAHYSRCLPDNALHYSSKREATQQDPR